MPTKYSQSGRGIALATPLGPDVLLLQGLTGTEALSELFRFDLDLLVEVGRGEIAFDQILGRQVGITLGRKDGPPREIYGVVSRFTQGPEVRGPLGTVTFVRYRATVVPQFWYATRRWQSRIFQQKTVPDILKAVLGEVHPDPKPIFKLLGTYEPRDYCVQYRETDFDFASRLMEEEGIYYYWLHADGKHTLVVSDHPKGHADVAAPATLPYDTDVGGVRPQHRVLGWEKTQEIRTGRHTLWDHCFELPHKNLEAKQSIQQSVSVGRVSHDLRAGGGGQLERYDFPGGYAQRFDGVGPGGADRAADVAKIAKDNERTTKLRAEEEAARTLQVAGQSECRQLTAGHQFTLSGHFNADGKYTLTRVTHRADMGAAYAPVAGGESDPHYSNEFRCVPAALPWRPERTTEKPYIAGTQTAVVVGPGGEEIFTDKYGRVKVRFFWDRQAKGNEESSCWVRVSQVHAGKNWGGIDVPRVDEELVIAFEEGDPDRPIAIGRVYNAREMPPFGLPGKKMVSGLKSNTYPGGGGNNEISMDDTAGNQRMYVHAQFNQDEVVENNQTSHVKLNRTKTVDVDEATTIGNNRTEKVGVNEEVTIGADRKHTVMANHDETIGANMSRNVGGSKSESVGMTATETVALAKAITVGGAMAISVGAAMNTAVGGVSFEEVGLSKKVIVGTKLEIVCGASRIVLEAGGKVTIEGTEFLFKASGDVKVVGSVIDLN